MPKKFQTKNINILRTKRAFKVEQKSFFVIFKMLLVAENSLKPESALLRTYDNIWKIANGQSDDYTLGFLLDYLDFRNYYKMIAIDLIKQQALDAFHQMLLVIPIVRVIFYINCYLLIHKFLCFVKLLQIIPQLI